MRPLERYGLVFALIALCLVNTAIRPDVFLTPENLRNIVNQNAVIGLVAVGMTLVIVTGGIDLSVGSIVAFSATTGLFALNRLLAQAVPEGLAVLGGLSAAIGIGLLCGLLNGVLVARARLAPFIATLCGLVAFRSFALTPASAGEITSMSRTVLPAIGQGGIPGLTVGAGNLPLLTWNILAFGLAAALGWFVLEKTTLGRNMLAVGGNEIAARLAGVRVERTKIAAYAITGTLCGVGAFLAAARMNSVSTPQIGVLYELDAIAAVAIGGASLAGGVGSVGRTVVGVLVLAVIQNTLALTNVSVFLHGFVKGAIILVAVLLQRGRANA